MPRITPLLQCEQLQENLATLTDKYYLLMKQNKLKLADIAELTGVTPQAVGSQFRRRRMTLETAIAIEMLVGD